MKKIDPYTAPELLKRKKRMSKAMWRRYADGVSLAGVIIAVAMGSKDEKELKKTIDGMKDILKKFTRTCIEDAMAIIDIYSNEELSVYECADMYYGVK